MSGGPSSPADVSVVVRFAPAASATSPRGVAFRAETGQRIHFASFAELELALRHLVNGGMRPHEEEISAQ